MEKVVRRMKKKSTMMKTMIKCLLNTNSLHKIFFSQNFVSEKLVRKILTNIIIFFLNQTMKKVVQTRRRRVQQCEKLLLLGAHRELPGSSSQLRVLSNHLFITAITLSLFSSDYFYESLKQKQIQYSHGSKSRNLRGGQERNGHQDSWPTNKPRPNNP
jgi:hypothetical protein